MFTFEFECLFHSFALMTDRSLSFTWVRPIFITNIVITFIMITNIAITFSSITTIILIIINIFEFTGVFSFLLLLSSVLLLLFLIYHHKQLTVFMQYVLALFLFRSIFLFILIGSTRPLLGVNALPEYYHLASIIYSRMKVGDTERNDHVISPTLFLIDK